MDYKTTVPVANQPKTKIIEMKLSIADMNPFVDGAGMLRISFPAKVTNPIVAIEAQIELADTLGEDNYELLEQRITKMVNAAIISDLLGKRIK